MGIRYILSSQEHFGCNVFSIPSLHEPPGTLWNMKSTLPAARQAQTLSAVAATLSQSLELDAGVLIPELRRAEEVRHASAPAVADVEEQAAEAVAVEEMDEEEVAAVKHKRNGKAAKTDNDFSDFLPVSDVSV